MNVRSARIMVLLLCSLTAMSAYTSEDQLVPVRSDLSSYGRAEKAAHHLYSDLQSFICTERVDRFRNTEDGQTTVALDTLFSQLSFENGVETYSGILQNGKSLSRMSDLDGAWSKGEFGTLIFQTGVLLSSAIPSSSRYEELDGVPANLFSFEVPETRSPWDLEVGTLHFKVPFHLDVWVSQLTGEIVKIVRTSTAVPSGTGIYQIVWGVTLGPVNLNGRTWLLPKSGEYVVSYEDSFRRDSNLLTFSGYHRYDALSVIKFDNLQENKAQ